MSSTVIAGHSEKPILITMCIIDAILKAFGIIVVDTGGFD
jgi:hypothetical protein